MMKTKHNRKKAVQDFSVLPSNFVSTASSGIYIYSPALQTDWCISLEKYNSELYKEFLDDSKEIVDISIDPESHLLSLINYVNVTRVYYLTLYHPLRGKRGKRFKTGITRNDLGQQRCTSFVITLPPQTVMDVCYILDVINITDINIESDIEDFTFHPLPYYFDSRNTYIFPFFGEETFLCTQCFNGELTHFLPTSYHAVDFRCPVGTPLIAISSGIIIDIKQNNNVSGISIDNLFLWNSVKLLVDNSNICIEYVHIKSNSVLVDLNCHVNKGDIICQSGDVGFCPEPHLHLEVHPTSDSSSPTLKFAFLSEDTENKYYFPIAGVLYSKKGPCL